ncbi:FHA domain-containing protein [Mycena kentingensis (nom. inval.)]|nr:FHA domain-containing protein [Mycena kentingensis (nom. inval.)]
MDVPGRFGTIALLRKNSADDVVTSFGVDSTTVTFGREQTCTIRLYYPDVDPVHARIVFNDDRKAFLEVLGENGLLVDGCHVYPNLSSTKTIPLANGSEVHIHGKRFRFNYPPKDRRAALAASPARPANRALRLSMIASAQVFSPRPSHIPQENLRVLQSPMRAPFPRSPSRSRSPSPTKNRAAIADEEDDEIITLVQGSSPRVVEEERDLVILEDVEVAPPARAQTPPQTIVIPPAPKTPRAGRQSLHRAVLIRSAHRAVLAATNNSGHSTPSNSSGSSNATPVVSIPKSTSGSGVGQPLARGPVSPTKTPYGLLPTGADEDSDDTDTDTEEEEAEVRALGLEVVSVSSGSDEEDEQQEGEQEDRPQPRLGWRKSLERLWPFGGRVKTEEEEATLPPAPHNDADDDESDDDMDIETTAPAPPPLVSPKRKTVATPTPISRSPSKTPTTFGRRSPEKSIEQARTPLGHRSPAKLPSLGDAMLREFGAPVQAKTPKGFGRRSGEGIPGAGLSTADKEPQVAPMDVDEETPYQPLYADLAADAKQTQAEEEPAKPTPVRRLNLAAFMTPQPTRVATARTLAIRPVQTPGPTLGQPRQSSVGPGGPQRIPIAQSPWKRAAQKIKAESPVSNAMPPPATPRVKVSEEERKAIQERRRSALNAPDLFWADGAPGMSPRKNASPVKKAGAGVFGLGGVAEGQGEVDFENVKTEEKKDDPASMLKGLLDNVDVLKKRRESVLVEVERRKSLAGSPVKAATADIAMDVDEETAPAPTPPRKTPTKAKRVENEEAQEQEQAPIVPPPTPPKKTMRRARSRVPTTEADSDPAQTPAPAKARRGRKAAAEPEVEEAEEPAPLPVVPAAPAKTRRGRSVSKEPETVAPPVKTRRGRSQAAAEQESDAEEEQEQQVAPAPRKARKPPSVTAQAAPVSEPARRGRAAKTAAAPAAPASAPERKTTRARSKAPIEKEKETSDDELEVVAVVPPKRRVGSKKTTTAAPAVKEEETEPVLVPKKPASVPKPRSTRKTPASMPAAVPGVEKENQNESEEEVVVRVSRSRKGKEKVAEAEVLEAEGTAAPRRTRTRTRT